MFSILNAGEWTESINPVIVRNYVVRIIFVPRITKHRHSADRFSCLVVRVLGYRFGGPGSIPSTTRKKAVGLGRGALSLVSTTERSYLIEK
jgi:hypothetical protein